MNYAALAVTCARLIRTAGKAMTLTRVTAGTLDPREGTTTGKVTTAYSVYGVEQEYSAYERDGTLIQATDKRIMLSPESVQPVPGDKISISGSVASVINCQIIKPSTTVMFYDVQVRI